MTDRPRGRLDLRPGARVEWQPAHAPQSMTGKLIRPAANNEEWLVENRFGRFWIHVTRLRPAD